MRKHPSAYNEVVRGVKLEEEEFAGGQGPKGGRPARRPEIHLVRCLSRKEIEPVLICDAEEDLDHVCTLRRRSK